VIAPDLHPEELLEREAAGTLSAEERPLLQAHLAQCPTCRFELQARADFAQTPMGAMDLDGLVTRALAGLPTASAPVAPPRRRRRGGALVAAALALTAVSSFAAAKATGVWPKLLAVLTGAAVLEPKPVPAAAPLPRAATPTAPSAPTVPVDEERLSPPPPPPPPQAARPRAQRTATLAPSAAPPPAPAVLVEAPPADVVFSEANRARAHGDHGLALTLYRQLQERYPRSDEATLSHATLGRLLLDSGDAAAAQRELSTYLAAGDGALREEALAASAQAASKLGQPEDEAQAWSLLLATYPDSLHAEHARARLRALRVP
jgi:TolA-binding protein